MKKFLSWLKALVVGTLKIADKTADILHQVTDKALPVVEMIAAATPNRTDDEIIALYKQYAVPNVDKYLGLPEDQRGDALANAGAYLVQKALPKVPVSQIKAGIELALQIFKDNTTRAAQ